MMPIFKSVLFRTPFVTQDYFPQENAEQIAGQKGTVIKNNHSALLRLHEKTGSKRLETLLKL